MVKEVVREKEVAVNVHSTEPSTVRYSKQRIGYNKDKF